MVHVIMGVRGSGKTKQLIALVNEAAAAEKGAVVCLEHGNKLTYDIKYSTRLVDTKENHISGYPALKAFISGLYAGNYDISKVFIDSLGKVAQDQDLKNAEEFLAWVDQFGAANGVDFVITISADINAATDGIKKYF